jgi:hypothetical protein
LPSGIVDTECETEIRKPARPCVRPIDVVAFPVLVDNRESVSGPQRAERARCEFAVWQSDRIALNGPEIGDLVIAKGFAKAVL